MQNFRGTAKRKLGIAISAVVLMKKDSILQDLKNKEEKKKSNKKCKITIKDKTHE